ncbi:cytochrome P450 [Streptomyces spectabilis]|uniref:Cytochrome P450 n=1 Tax=Streptomyces spectabilis TaxID=68270 RepID=A0A516R1M8_STRST|nr:cytochrome P450 [Streptomyces spectabilis]QDQ09551.1 cytochrome P450 [Streptomyces spectabilis]
MCSEGPTLDELDEDPYPIYARLRAEAPVSWVPSLNAWLVTRWHDVRQVANLPESFTTANSKAPLADYCGPQNILTLEGDRHAAVRESVDDCFSWTRASAAVAHTRAIAADQLRTLAGRDEADLMGEYFEPVTVAALGRFMGLEGIAPTTLAHWSKALTDALHNPEQDSGRAQAGRAAVADIDQVVGARLKELAARPDDSVLSRLLRSGCPQGTSREPEAVLSTLKMMLSAFREPSWLAGNTLYALMSRADQLAALRQDPQVLGAAVHEGVRWGAPVGVIGRLAVKDVALNGVEIPAGATVLSAIASANRDETVFPAGEEFDLRRPPAPCLTLGYGRHACLAADLVPKIVEAALATLLHDGPAELRMTDDVRPRGWKFRKLESLRVGWH